MEITERIIKLCSENNISGVELGKKLGLKKSPLTDWKNQKSKPTLEQIIIICDIFAISADYILFGKVNHVPHQSKEENSIDEQNLIDIYRDIDDYGKHEIQSYIREIWAEHRITKKGTLSHSEENDMIG